MPKVVNSFRNTKLIKFLTCLLAISLLILFRKPLFYAVGLALAAKTSTRMCIGLILLVSILIHEVIHGIMFTLFGGKVVYKLKLPSPSTREMTGIALKKHQYFAMAIVPTVVICGTGILLSNYIGDLLFILNLIAGSSDIITALSLLKYGGNYRIVDVKGGYDVVDS